MYSGRNPTVLEARAVYGEQRFTIVRVISDVLHLRADIQWFALEQATRAMTADLVRHGAQVDEIAWEVRPMFTDGDLEEAS